MPLDGSTFDGGSHGSPWCRACKQPIWKNQRSTRVEFQTDPHGANGLTGDYHQECSRPFASLARVVNLNPWSGW
jgi:hypothetical protein